MPKRENSPTSDSSNPTPPPKKVKEASEPKSPAKNSKILAEIKAEIVDLLFGSCSSETAKVIADRVGLSNQQMKSQIVGGGRANLRKNIVDALRSGKLA